MNLNRQIFALIYRKRNFFFHSFAVISPTEKFLLFLRFLLSLPQMASDHPVIFHGIGIDFSHFSGHHIFGNHFPDPSVCQHGCPVTDIIYFFEMRTDIKKRKAFCRIVPDDFVKLFQFTVTDQRPDFLQHDQVISCHDRPQQFYDHTLKNRQTLDSRICRYFNPDFF